MLESSAVLSHVPLELAVRQALQDNPKAVAKLSRSSSRLRTSRDPSRLSRLGSRRQLTDEEAEIQRKLVHSKSASFRHGATSAVEPRLAVMAARQGDETLVREFLRQHQALINAALEDEYTLLHVAAESGQGRICALLLANGASAEAVDSDLQTPLHVAAACGKLEAALVLAKKPCKELLQPDKYKMTPFHLACESGSREIVEYFVKTHKIHKDMRKGSGLFIAQRNDHASVVSLLEEASMRIRLSGAASPRGEECVLDVIADRKSRPSHDASAASDRSPWQSGHTTPNHTRSPRQSGHATPNHARSLRQSGHTTPNHTSNFSPVHTPTLSPLNSPCLSPAHPLATLSSSLNALAPFRPSPCQSSASQQPTSQPSTSQPPTFQRFAAETPPAETPLSDTPPSQRLPTLAFAVPPDLRSDAAPTARSRKSRASDDYDGVTPEPLRNNAASDKSSVRSKERVSFVEAGGGGGGDGDGGGGSSLVGSGRVGSASGRSSCDAGGGEDRRASAGADLEELSASGLPLRMSQIISRNRYNRKLAAGELDEQKPDTKADRKSSMCNLL